MEIKEAKTRRERRGDLIFKYVITPPLIVTSMLGVVLVYAFPLWVLWSVGTFTINLVTPEKTEVTK